MEQYDVKRVYPNLWGLHAVTIIYALANYEIRPIPYLMASLEFTEFLAQKSIVRVVFSLLHP